MKIPYNILIQIKMSVRPYFKGFTLIFFFSFLVRFFRMPCAPSGALPGKKFPPSATSRVKEAPAGTRHT